MKHPQWVSATIGIQIQSRFTSREGKGSETGERMASGWQIYRIPGLLSIKMGSISAFPTDSQTRPPPAPIRGGRDESELEPNTVEFRIDHHLWGHWTFLRTSWLLTLN